MGSDNWNASGCKGLSPMITIQPTTDVILLGSVLNWKKKQRSCYPYSNYLVYETILIVKISYFFLYIEMVLKHTYRIELDMS